MKRALISAIKIKKIENLVKRKDQVFMTNRNLTCYGIYNYFQDNLNDHEKPLEWMWFFNFVK